MAIVLAVFLLPIVFYLPKFFEVRSKEVSVAIRSQIDCTEFARFRASWTSEGFQGLAQQSMLNFNTSRFPPECAGKITKDFLNASSVDDSDVFVFNITRRVQQFHIFPTALRRNRLYYKVYCIGLNTLVATVLPLLSLLYLNVRTVVELSKMMKQEDSMPLTTNSTPKKKFPFWRRRQKRPETNGVDEHQLERLLFQYLECI